MTYKTTSKCKDCGKSTSHPKSLRCRKCADKNIIGKGHWNWQGGKPKCLDCNKKLSTNKTKRCSACNGKLKLGKNNPCWKGGKHLRVDGYRMIYNPDHPCCNQYGYIREHRLKMEKHLKRYLTKKEVVHHINGIKTDNRIKNLMIFKNQIQHAKHHAEERRKCH